MAAPEYQARAAAAVAALQGWYVPRTGLWKSAGWWNAANALTAVIGYAKHTGDNRHAQVVATTFRRARRRHPDFVNMFFDDNGWWALAWVAAYDLTGENQYLDAARTIFARNLAGWDEVCGGGLWWNTKRTYKNAITNELFITLAAQLHERTPGDQEYLSWALRGWEWLTGAGPDRAERPGQRRSRGRTAPTTAAPPGPTTRASSSAGWPRSTTSPATGRTCGTGSSSPTPRWAG